MIRLLGVELTRFRKRRAVAVLLLIGVVAPLVVLSVVLWETRPVSSAEVREAQQQVERERAQPYVQRQLARCERRPERYGIRATDPAVVAQRCDEMVSPQVEWFISREQLDVRDHLRGTGMAIVALTTVLLMLAAATYVGHDWNSGSMSNQLLFEPRRQRVFWAKALAVVLMALLSAALAHLVLWVGLLLAASVRDVAVPDGFLGTVASTYGRAALLTAAAALGAYGVTNLFRSTVVTLGLMFGVVVAGSIVVGLLPLVDRERFHLPVNAVAWIQEQARYFRYVPDTCFLEGRPPEGMDCRQQGRLDLWGAARYFGTLLALALGLSAWSFQRRDVP